MKAMKWYYHWPISGCVEECASGTLADKKQSKWTNSLASSFWAFHLSPLQTEVPDGTGCSPCLQLTGGLVRVYFCRTSIVTLGIGMASHLNDNVRRIYNNASFAEKSQLMKPEVAFQNFGRWSLASRAEWVSHGFAWIIYQTYALYHSDSLHCFGRGGTVTQGQFLGYANWRSQLQFPSWAGKPAWNLGEALPTSAAITEAIDQ